jgi:hypothetical protein
LKQPTELLLHFPRPRLLAVNAPITESFDDLFIFAQQQQQQQGSECGWF